MRVLQKASLLVIVLLAALFASFMVTGNVAYAEDPPKISNHLYDPGNKMGSQAGKVKERLASLDRSGLHVYVAFPSEYSNDTVSNWNLMALQKSGAPQGSYMLSIVADNPNQTMYLASADNAAKLSQEELSAIASDKMVPLLNQQKYPEAVLAYLDALSAKAPEMGSGLAVAPWAMIAFLIALIVVIVVLSRMLKARRKAKERIEEKEQPDVLTSQAVSSPVAPSTPATREPTAPVSSVSADSEAETGEEDARPGKVPSLAELDQIALARTKAASQALAGTTGSAHSPVQSPHSPQAVVSQTPAVQQPQQFQPQVTQAQPQVQQPAVTQQQEAQAPKAQVPQAHTQPATPQPQPVAPAPQTVAPGLSPVPPAQPPASSPLAATAAPATPAAAQTSPSPRASAPQPHSSVLHPGATTYLPPQANDDDTQVTSAAQIKDYGQERRDEIARAKARAQAMSRFRQEQAKKQPSPALGQPVSYQPDLSPQATASSLALQAVAPVASPIPGQAFAAPQTPQGGSPISSVAPAEPAASASQTAVRTPDTLAPRPQPAAPSSPAPTPAPQVVPHEAPQPAPQATTPVAPQAIPQVSAHTAAPAPRVETSQAPRQPQAVAPSYPAPTPAPQTVPQETPQVAPQPAPQASVHAAPQTPQKTRERPAEPGAQPDFTKVLRQADSWARKGSSKLALAQDRFGKSITQPFALALVRAQDAVRAAFAEFATAQLQSRPVDQQIVAGNLPAPLRELRDQITHFTNLYHQQTPLPDITRSFERQIIECREELVRCRLIVERIQKDDPQKATRIGEDVMGAHKLLARAQNLLEEAQTMDRAGCENEVLKATVRTENLLLQGRKIARQARAEEAGLRAAEKVTQALTFEEKVEPLSEQVAILMAAVDDYIGVHTAQVGVASRTMLDLANRTLTRLDRPGSVDTQEALRLLQRARQQTEQALRLAENDVAKRS
ncbi:hypothetical protein [uncultured Varibaculum sp.]|uniref:hypothetical protein n=1 Tax=uncultured Varibaculum sp. TaxID=413896 RepID=UPI00259398AF|nr:hypothetical protein [uncultured Varibaculum sp.]